MAYLTNLRSVMWTKVSVKEAKIRATPKTSSPIERFVSCLLGSSQKFFAHRIEKKDQFLPSRTEGPREMFSWGARGAFLGGMLDLVDSSKLAVENEESPKSSRDGQSPVLVVVGGGQKAQSGPPERWGAAETELFRSKFWWTGTWKPCPRRSFLHSVWLPTATPHSTISPVNFFGGCQKRRKILTTPSPTSPLQPSPSTILTDITNSRRRQNGCLVCVFPLNNVRRYGPLRLYAPAENKTSIFIADLSWSSRWAAAFFPGWTSEKVDKPPRMAALARSILPGHIVLYLSGLKHWLAD